MTWEQQTLPRFMKAHRLASDFLQNETSRQTPLGFREAIVLQAAGHILAEHYLFTVPHILELTLDYTPGTTVFPIIVGFVDLELFVSQGKLPTKGQGRPPRGYRATELGGQVLDIFQ